MKNWKSALWLKLLAGFLLIVFVLGLCAAGLASIMLYGTNAYSDCGAQLIDSYFPYSCKVFSQAMDTANSYYQDYTKRQKEPDNYSPQWERYYLHYFDPDNTNFYFAVYDENGSIVFSGGEGTVVKDGKTDFSASTYLCEQPYAIHVRSNERPVVKTVSFESEDALWQYVEEQYAREDTYDFDYARTGSDESHTLRVSYTEFDWAQYTLVGYARETLNVHDGIWQEYRLLNWLVVRRYSILILCVLFALLSIADFVLLMCCAGHSAKTEGIHLTWFDRIPLDLLLLVWAALGGIYIAFGLDLSSNVNWSIFSAAAAVAVSIVFFVLLVLSFLMSLAARCKAGGWYKNTVIFRILRQLGRFFRLLLRGLRYLRKNLPLYWKAGLIWAALCFVELLFIAVTGCTGSFFLWWLLGRTILTAALVLAVINMKKLRDGGEKLATGALTSQIDTSHMFWEFKRHAENLNSIADGMQKAVEQQMRSERLKTELITNVSHDIKTPLTSIVSYVDLLKKEKMPSDAARQYLDVLDRQSARLKKLTEDLVEASKASTGNLSCTLEPTDVNVLLGQVMGEYEGKLEAGQLEPIVLEDPSSPKILADGRLLWRVFDNLLSNICKYAMPGTRVYLSSAVENGKVVICFKNISRSALNISADELMERFVRGDSSRNTEGSGLGLSIAQSLTSLQQGTFALSVDGDLFKASVTFDALF